MKRRLGLVVLHAGGIGDLVLFSGALAAIRAANPKARITLVTRRAIAPLVGSSPLRSAVDSVVALPLDPYRWAAPSKSLFAAVERVFAAVGGRRCDVFVSAELAPTWLSWVLAAKLRPRVALTLRNAKHSRALVAAVCARFGLRVPAFRRYADARSQVHELARYERLARALGADEVAAPHWPLPATGALRARGLTRHSYIACFPCGTASTPLKRWRSERFVAALAGVRERFGGRVLIAGAASEGAELRAFARRCAAAGLEPHVFAGGPRSLGTLRALVANAWGYLGNDTGPAHLAAVHGVPGVVVYGGGTWPMYAPWSPGTVGVVHPLPCFGCFWDCAFGRAVCHEEIPAAPVLAALELAVAGPTAAPATFSLARLDGPTLALIADASATYREAQRDRAARLEALLALARKSSSR